MKTNTIFSVASLGLLLLAISCSGAVSDYCDKYIDCEGGNDKDRDACVEEFNSAEDIAGDYDCSDQFDKAIDCTDTLACVNGKIDEKPCAEQSKALSACIKAASGKNNDTTVTTSSSSSSSSSSSGG